MASVPAARPPPPALDRDEAASLDAHWRAANYLAAAQIFLQENALLREPLRPAHIKERLLGHWGTCPGINLVHAHLNRIVRRDDRMVLLVTGPGHGAPANLANLYLEGTLAEFYPEYARDAAGLERFVRAFSWPGGFPSHLYPGVPATIHEGGELGYALATAFGAAFDNPDLLVACIVGDGEAESGPTAAAWHGTKFLDPAESGAVLPILHLNGYKISNPTIFGAMDDDELLALFSGYGWQPTIVDSAAGAVHGQMASALDTILAAIDDIQHAARSGRRLEKPRWPLLILRTPKGWTGIRERDGQPVEGSFRAHQVPAPSARSDPGQLRLLEAWLRSYRPDELFDREGRPHRQVTALHPAAHRRLGSCPHGYGGRLRIPLERPPLREHAVEIDPRHRGSTSASPIEVEAGYLASVIARNPRRFRIFCPDELMSNRLGAVFDAPTQRGFQWPVEEGGRAEHVGRAGGRVLEILSEHTCQAWLQGYVLTGRHGLFPSYESFLPIVTSMMDQFAKFLDMSGEFPWRLPVSSLNYLETSTLWRQEHNGFSHQNPGFINALLNKKGDIMRVYLPPDSNCLLSTLDHCLGGIGHVNLVVANKTRLPTWLTLDEAIAHCRAGASIWRWASTDGGISPDVVLVGIGDIPTREVLAAADILARDVPELRVRVVNVTDLLILEREGRHPHGLDDALFEALFTADRPVVVNFHGYPSAVKQLLAGRRGAERFAIRGYQEEGTTTTPFDMLVRNGTSRYDLATHTLRAAASINPVAAVRAPERVLHYEYVLRSFREEIRRTGNDPDEISSWTWTRKG